MKNLVVLITITLLLGSCRVETDYFVKYEFTYVRDSTGVSSKYIDEMVLITKDSGYGFFSNDLFQLDTISGDAITNLKSNSMMFIQNSKNLTSPNNHLKLYFHKGLNQYNIQTVVNSLTYKFKDEVPNIKWEFLGDEKEILNYKVKNAKTNLFGKEWIAWYTESIPVPYGPYKFKDLPGLILSVEDTKKQFKFELREIKIDTTTYKKLYANQHDVNVTKEEFLVKVRAYKDNPIQVTQFTGDDSTMDKKLLEERKLILKHFNNSIEKGVQFDLK